MIDPMTGLDDGQDPTKPVTQSVDPAKPNYVPSQSKDPALPGYKPARMASDAANFRGPDTTPNASIPDALRLAEDQATLGLGTRANAALRSLFGGGSYQQTLADEKAKLAAAGQKGYAAAAEAAGNIPLLFGPGILKALGITATGAEALSTGRKIVEGMKAGATIGGVAGLAHSNVDAPNMTATDRVLEALRGTGMGAATGAAVGGAATAIPAGVSAASRFVRDLPMMPGSSGRFADQYLLKQLNAGNIDIPTEAARLQGLSAGGAPVMVGDAGQGVLTGAAKAAAATPGSDAGARIQAATAERVVSRPSRMSADLSNVTGTNPLPMPQYADALHAQAGTEGDQLFAHARANSPRVTLDPTLQKRLQTPTLQQAFKDAVKARQASVDAGELQPLESPFTTQGDVLQEALKAPAAAPTDRRLAAGAAPDDVERRVPPSAERVTIKHPDGSITIQPKNWDQLQHFTIGGGENTAPYDFSTPAGAPAGPHPADAMLADLQATFAKAHPEFNGKIPKGLTTDMLLQTPEGQAWASKQIVRPTMDPSTLDAMVTQLGESANPNTPGASKVEGKGLVSLKAQLQDHLDQQAPLFSDARSRMALLHGHGNAAELGYELGGKYANMGADEIKAQMANIDPAMLPSFRTGVLAKMRQSLSYNRIQALLDEKRAGGVDPALAALLGDQPAAELSARYNTEGAMKPFESTMSGSQTTPLALAQRQLGAGLPNTLAGAYLKVAPGIGNESSIGRLGMYVKALRGVSEGINASRANAIADRLLAGGAQIPGVMDVLAKKQNMQSKIGSLWQMLGMAGANNAALQTAPDQRP